MEKIRNMQKSDAPDMEMPDEMSNEMSDEMPNEMSNEMKDEISNMMSNIYILSNISAKTENLKISDDSMNDFFRDSMFAMRVSKMMKNKNRSFESLNKFKNVFIKLFFFGFEYVEAEYNQTNSQCGGVVYRDVR